MKHYRFPSPGQLLLTEGRVLLLYAWKTSLWFYLRWNHHLATEYCFFLSCNIPKPPPYSASWPSRSSSAVELLRFSMVVYLGAVRMAFLGFNKHCHHPRSNKCDFGYVCVCWMFVKGRAHAFLVGIW